MITVKAKVVGKVKGEPIVKNRNHRLPSMIFLIMMVMLFSGCAPLFVGAGVTTAVMESRKPLSDVVKINQNNLKSLTYGISEKFALEIMGQKSLTAYEKEKKILILNPYKTEYFRRGHKSYKAMYYVTDVVVADDVFTKEELTPLIFEQEVLIGWGWDFLNKKAASFPP